MINARTNVPTRERKEFQRNEGHHLFGVVRANECPEQMMWELDFEESAVILVVKNLGTALWGEGETHAEAGAMNVSNCKLMKYKGRGYRDLS